MKIDWRDFSKGLILKKGPEEVPRDGLFRAKGISPFNPGRSRWGSDYIGLGLACYALYRAFNYCFSTIGNRLYKFIKSTGTMNQITAYENNNGDASPPTPPFLTANKHLSFSKMPPSPGLEDYLFVAGGQFTPDGNETEIDYMETTVTSRWTATYGFSYAVDTTVYHEGSQSLQLTANVSSYEGYTGRFWGSPAPYTEQDWSSSDMFNLWVKRTGSSVTSMSAKIYVGTALNGYYEKTDITLDDTTEWQLVSIPFKDFDDTNVAGYTWANVTGVRLHFYGYASGDIINLDEIYRSQEGRLGNHLTKVSQAFDTGEDSEGTVNRWSKWGIDAPDAEELSAAPFEIAEDVFELFDTAGDWTPYRCTRSVVAGGGYDGNDCFKVNSNQTNHKRFYITRSTGYDLSGENTNAGGNIRIYVKNCDPNLLITGNSYQYIWLQFDVDDGSFTNFYQYKMSSGSDSNEFPVYEDATTATWKQVDLPKGNFTSYGTMIADGTKDWSDVQYMRIVFRMSIDPYLYSYYILIDDMSLTQEGIVTGTYKYDITYKNSHTGNRSNGAGEVEVDVDEEGALLGNIPQPEDPQVDKIEIWRSQLDGTSLFRLTEIDVGDTEYSDTPDDDDLESTELPITNNVPYGWFDHCIGPYNASMFWITRTHAGDRGRLYHSRIGRPESMEGFINVTNDDDALQNVVIYTGNLYAISETGWHQITGTNPYVSRPIGGTPGTFYPHTVAVTPYGVAYCAPDGVRLFTGTQAKQVATFDNVKRIFRNESIGDLTAFTPLVATYARDEYIVSDGSQTIAVNLTTGKWRDYGRGYHALYYAQDADYLLASTSTYLYALDDEDVTTDGLLGGVPFSLEPGHALTDPDHKAQIQYMHIDAVASGAQYVKVYIIVDGTEYYLGNLQILTTRDKYSFSVGKQGRIVGWRIESPTAGLQDTIEIFGVRIEGYVIGE